MKVFKNDTELQNAIHEMKIKEKQIEALKAEADDIRNDIKNHMDYQGLVQYLVGPYKLIYDTVYTSRFNVKAFKAEHGDLYQKFMDTVPTKPLKVL